MMSTVEAGTAEQYVSHNARRANAEGSRTYEIVGINFAEVCLESVAVPGLDR